MSNATVDSSFNEEVWQQILTRWDALLRFDPDYANVLEDNFFRRIGLLRQERDEGEEARDPDVEYELDVEDEDDDPIFGTDSTVDSSFNEEVWQQILTRWDALLRFDPDYANVLEDNFFRRIGLLRQERDEGEEARDPDVEYELDVEDEEDDPIFGTDSTVDSSFNEEVWQQILTRWDALLRFDPDYANVLEDNFFRRIGLLRQERDEGGEARDPDVEYELDVEDEDDDPIFGTDSTVDSSFNEEVWQQILTRWDALLRFDPDYANVLEDNFFKKTGIRQESVEEEEARDPDVEYELDVEDEKDDPIFVAEYWEERLVDGCLRTPEEWQKKIKKWEKDLEDALYMSSLRVERQYVLNIQKELIKRPTIVADYGNKITDSVRQRCLNLMVDEYMKFDAECPLSRGTNLALKGEYDVYKSSNSKLVYFNKAIEFIKKLRGQSSDIILRIPKKNADKPLISKNILTPLPIKLRLEHIVTGRVLYERLRSYILTEDELQENQFPRPDGFGAATFYLSDLNGDPFLESDERLCVRCQKCYHVNSDDKSIVDNDCTYHWAKHVPTRVGNSYENLHKCCQGERGSKGCRVANHVHHQNKFDGSSGYISTPKRPISHEGPGVFAMDCEMVYTTAGMELAQITVVDSQCVTIYESFVKPDHEVVDYNTRFSGVTEDDLKDCQVSLRQVQAVLLHNFSANTIVVGHSLECDLRAVKLVHSTVIDTSVLFPHEAGRPFKTALRVLAQDHLKETIQEGENGHDSKEDAISAMRLVHYRMNQDGNNSRQ